MKTLENAIHLRKNGKTDEAIVMLKALIAEEPENAAINYQLAWCCDVKGLEKEAVPYYEKAIAVGLPEADQIEAIIGLGSTYRAIGAYEKSKALLQQGVKTYDNNALKVFLAMTLYNLGEYEQSVGTLLKLLAETSSDKSIGQFKKAIHFYSEHLNDTL
ncbi:tetratricopeptide repeat protein [Fusibacter paucivorans]|uniref:Tetratricopeptide repeat protein n=1 Tax=Fusibacter paucivorans TaxID=76009 RepID=A0ABS5PTI2_9FIRM|nr:tetratricopeptide repeat protein [Fusibacter paucivorans]MBS7528485.1 tetratricopeptide repeat protein [Fusibacter paucivorans]